MCGPILQACDKAPVQSGPPKLCTSICCSTCSIPHPSPSPHPSLSSSHSLDAPPSSCHVSLRRAASPLSQPLPHPRIIRQDQLGWLSATPCLGALPRPSQPLQKWQGPYVRCRRRVVQHGTGCPADGPAREAPLASVTEQLGPRWAPLDCHCHSPWLYGVRRHALRVAA